MTATDILSRLAALSSEHSSIFDAREYIRRGFGFTASGGERRWHLSDEEISCLQTAFRLRDDAFRSLIALMQEAAGEIQRLRDTLQDIEGMDEGASSRYLGDIAREALKQKRSSS